MLLVFPPANASISRHGSCSGSGPATVIKQYYVNLRVAVCYVCIAMARMAVFISSMLVTIFS